MAVPTTPTRLTDYSDSYQPADWAADLWVQGLAGNDAMSGGYGNDKLDGGAGNDWLSGGDGNDTLIGGLGSDSLYGQDGDDRIIGRIDASDSTNADRVDGGAGYDTLVFTEATNAAMSFVRGIENIVGSSGNDVVDLNSYLSHSGSVGPQPGEPGYDPRYAGGVTLAAGGGADSIRGTQVDDKIYGGDGSDRLDGNAGNDRIDGGAGDDLINGGDGSDVLRGGAGFDVAFGGHGDDTFLTGPAAGGEDDLFLGGDGYDTVRLGEGVAVGAGAASATSFVAVTGVERIVGSAAGDNINLAGLSSVTNDNVGNDPFGMPLSTPPPPADPGVRVDAGAGDDRVTGTAYADRLYGGDGMDLLDGGDGNDHISGGAGQDFMSGGNGNDTLVAGAGQEIMAGGAGNDRFDLRAMGGGFNADVILMDFTKGEDKIDVRGLGFSLETAWIEQGLTGSGDAAVMIRLDGATFDVNGKYLSLAGVGAEDLSADMFLT